MRLRETLETYGRRMILRETGRIFTGYTISFPSQSEFVRLRLGCVGTSCRKEGKESRKMYSYMWGAICNLISLTCLLISTFLDDAQ